MPEVSQRSMVAAMRAFDAWEGASSGATSANYFELIFSYGLPPWFVNQAQSSYQWIWQQIFPSLLTGTFFSSNSYFSNESITGEYLSENQARALGRDLIRTLVAIAATLPTGEYVVRSLELDGFAVDREKAVLVPLEKVVSADEQSDLLGSHVRQSGLPNAATILTHIDDARSSFAQGKNHASLNESRSFLQALIDSISEETSKSGGHAAALPGGNCE